MKIIISPAKELSADAISSQRLPILIDQAKQLSQPNDFKDDTHYYEALSLYNGLQFRYLKADLQPSDINFLDDHLYILSALYGPVKPRDGIRPYRKDFKTKGLYKAWGDAFYQVVSQSQEPILNLASQEFSKTITPYLTSNDTFITCHFFEETNEGQCKKHSTISKKARGQLVHWIAKKRIYMIEDVKAFNDMGYHFVESESSDNEWVFVRERMKKD